MKSERHLASTITALLSALLITLFIVACRPKEGGPPPEPKGTDVFVTFEGPWAIVPDPNDSHGILALAPNTSIHRELAVVPANTTLKPGVYELSIPTPGDRVDAEIDNSILRATIEPDAVKHALENRGERYAIRLPKPDAYIAETRYPSRVSSKYPPDPANEKNYATAVSLRYRTTSKTGYQLSGTRDEGDAFKPALLEVNTPIIRFSIDPAEPHHDDCNLHARQAFHDLVRLVRLTLYIDFSGVDCHKQDPQRPDTEKSRLVNPPLSIEQSEAIYGREIRLRSAGFSGSLDDRTLNSLNSVAHFSSRLNAALYFFASDSGACRAPVILGN
jgi:hypothetical protein